MEGGTPQERCAVNFCAVVVTLAYTSARTYLESTHVRVHTYHRHTTTTNDNNPLITEKTQHTATKLSHSGALLRGGGRRAVEYNFPFLPNCCSHYHHSYSRLYTMGKKVIKVQKVYTMRQETQPKYYSVLPEMQDFTLFRWSPHNGDGMTAAHPQQSRQVQVHAQKIRGKRQHKTGKGD